MRRSFFRIIALALGAAAWAPTVASAQQFSTNYWVTANYLAVLGRQPDPGGWLYWTAWVAANGNNQTARLQFTADLLASAEYCGFFSQAAGCTNPPSDGQFLTLLYQNALGRPPDQDGWTFWLGQLANGVSRAQVVYDFINTTEFSGDYGGFCNSYSPGYANPLAYVTSASAVGGQETTVTVTYASPSGTTDLASGQIYFDSSTGCSVEWANPPSGPRTVTLDSGSTGCSLNQANSSVGTVPGNPKALAVTLSLTFFEQNFVGTHEVYAWGLDSEDLPSPTQDLGAFVVSQGQDFTISATPASATLPNLTYTTYLNVDVTVTSLNGFSGDVTISWSNGGNCGFTVTGPTQVWVPSGQSASVTISIENVPNYTNCLAGTYGSYVFWANSGSIWRSAPTVTVTVGSPPGFTVQLGAPTPVTLTNSGSVSYPVTVTPLNGFNGSVTLTVTGGLPTCTGGPTNCVSYSFTPSQVPQNGDWTSTLTLWTTSSNVPGGSFPIGVTGSATGYSPQTAGFTLSTLVTTVTAAPTPILNNGQPTSLSVTYNPTSPAISSCSVPLPDGSSNPYVSCQVSNSTAGSATLLIKATTAAHNGTYVVYGNGMAMAIHAAVFDAQPQGYGSGNSVPAGQTIEITASCLCPDPDDGEYAAAGGPDVEVSGPGGQQGWVYLDTWSATEMFLEASPAPGHRAGDVYHYGGLVRRVPAV